MRMKNCNQRVAVAEHRLHCTHITGRSYIPLLTKQLLHHTGGMDSAASAVPVLANGSGHKITFAGTENNTPFRTHFQGFLGTSYLKIY